MKRSIIAAFVAAALFIAPFAHADTSYVPIGDPYTDTLQLWSEIAAALSFLTNGVADLFNGHEFAATTQTTPTAQQPASLAAAAGSFNNNENAATSTETTNNATSDQTTLSQNVKSAEFSSTLNPATPTPPATPQSATSLLSNPVPAFDASAFVTREQFNAAMAALGSSVEQLLAVSQSRPLPQNVAADGNAVIPYAAENNISNLSNVTITNPTISGLTASEIPDLSSTYLSLNGGAVTGTTSFADGVGIGTTSPSDVLAVNGPIFLADVSPTATSNRLYSNAGSLFWNGSLIGGGSVGNWATDGTNVWRAGGNVGIATTSPGSALSVAGSGYFTSGIVASGNTTLGNATSSTFFSTIGDFTNGVINTLAGAQLSYTAATTTTFANYGTASFGGSATTTIDSAGDLTVAGNTTLHNATSTNFFATTASSTNLYAQTASLGTLTLAGTLSAQGGGTLSGTFSGTPIFNSGFISQASSTFSSTLNANTLNLINPLAVSSGGTGANTFGQGWIYSSGGTGALAASTSPTVNYLTATSTTATSTFAGNLSVGGNLNFNGSFLQNGSPFIGSQWTTNGSKIYYNTGNVGIGTTSPASLLSVAGNGYFTGNVGIGTANPSVPFQAHLGSNNNFIVQAVGGGVQFSSVNDAINSYNAMNVDGSPLYINANTHANVGIGTNSPSSPAGVAQTVDISNPSADVSIVLRDKGTNGRAFELLSSTSGGNGFFGLYDGTANAYRLWVDKNGNVGIGTINPYSRLQVTGPDTASTSAFTVVNSASTTVFSVFDDGNSTYSGSIFQSSDQRLKTDITSLDASSSLSAVELLNPVSYLRLDQPGTGENLGFIAQQVEQVFPQLVSTTSATALTPGGTLTLNYEGLISPIVSAIQALSADITNIENTISGFAQSVTSAVGNFGQVNTNQLCVGSTCVTPVQFQAMVAAANATQSSGQGSGTPSSGNTEATDTPPVIQINGSNPAIVEVGATYQDLGATVTGPQQDLNLGLTTYVNGTEMSPVQIDTTEAATDTIDYVATDQNGLTSTSSRTVIIEAPANDNQSTSTPANDNAPPPAATGTDSASSTTATSTSS